MSEQTWRQHCAPIISKVIAETFGGIKPNYTSEEVKLVRKKLLDAYPYYDRKNHPYKIWLDEIKAQLGLKKKKQKFEISANQMEIFK